MVLIVVLENSNRIVHVKSCFDRNDITVLDESEVKKKKTGLCFNSWVGIFVLPFISCIILLSLCYFLGVFVYLEERKGNSRGSFCSRGFIQASL